MPKRDLITQARQRSIKLGEIDEAKANATKCDSKRRLGVLWQTWFKACLLQPAIEFCRTNRL